MGKPKFWGNPRLNANLLSRKLRTPRKSLNFLQRASIIPTSHDCSNCGFTMTEVNLNQRRWKCPKCSLGVSMYTGTFLSNANISPRKMILLGIESIFAFTETIISYCQHTTSLNIGVLPSRWSSMKLGPPKMRAVTRKITWMVTMTRRVNPLLS